MPLMKEAMSKANFERSEKGLAPLKVVQEVRPDQVIEMKDEISMKDIPKGSDITLQYAGRYSRRNDEGVLFVGYCVELLILNKKDATPLKGWMVEGEFMAFVRTFRTQIDQQVINW